VEEEVRSSCHVVVKLEQSSGILQEQGIVPLMRPNWVSIRLEEEGVSEEKESAITTHHARKPSGPRAELCNCACCNFLCC